MKQEYNDYPENYSDNIITTLNQAYKNKEIKFPSFLQTIKESKPLEKTNIMQETNNQTQDREIYRLYSLISSNYCNLIVLFDNIIAKTSSNKREIYQTIRANLIVDQERFNETFYTICNSMNCNFCNYNSLIYTTISTFIDLTENLSSLAYLNQNPTEQQLIIRLRQNAYDLFRAFITARPLRV